MRQLNFPAMKTWLPQMESNHLPVGYQPTARPESLAAMGPSGRLELPCQPYQSCGSPSILAGNNYAVNKPWGRRGCSKSQPLAYETSVLPLELHRQITGASSQSLTGFPRIQILRIDGNAYEAKRAPASYRWTTPPLGRLDPNQVDPNQDFRQLGAVYQTRTGVCRLAVCRPSHWTNTANLWSGVRESNPSNWFGRPAPRRSVNPAKTHLSSCHITYS